MQKGGGTERQQAEQAMSKANVVYEGGASPGGEDAKGIALVDTWASPRDAGGWWMCCCCLDDNTKGGGMDLGVATCPYVTRSIARSYRASTASATRVRKASGACTVN